MQKSDLQDGMILVTRGRGNGILLAGSLKGSRDLYSSGGILKIDSLNDDLTYEVKEERYKKLIDYSIDKVYKISNMNNHKLPEIIDNLPLDVVELIWEREKMTKEQAIQSLRDLFYAGFERQSIRPTKKTYNRFRNSY